VTNLQDEQQLGAVVVFNACARSYRLDIRPELPARYDRPAGRSEFGIPESETLIGYFGF